LVEQKPDGNRTLKMASLNAALRIIIKRVKVKVNFTLEQATNAQRGSRGIALLLL
jgi:hypothetical protein